MSTFNTIPSPNLSTLAPITTAATALSNLVLVSPQSVVGFQPQAVGSSQPPYPAKAFLFNYEGEQSVRLESDITDHYVEDNTAVQDQIALHPEMIRTEGFISELNNIPPIGLNVLQQAAQKLTAIGVYTPGLSAGALIAYDEAFFLYQVAANAANSAVAAWNTVNGTGGESVVGSSGLQKQNSQNFQQQAFQTFYGYWRSRTLFTVQTPWAVFQNMAIQSIDAIQDETTNTISTFKLTFKMIRVAETLKSVVLPAQERAATQSAGLTNLGTSSLTQSSPFPGATGVVA